MWKEKEKKWEYVGEVVDPNAGAGASKETMGVVQGPKYYQGDQIFPAGKYDHIFDVELGDGVYRKLPFNDGANVIQAAENFCTREGLDSNNVE